MDNITIGFGADTTRLDAAIELETIKLRAFDAEAKKQFKAGNIGGAESASAQYAAALGHLRAMKSESAEILAHGQGFRGALREGAESLEKVKRWFSGGAEGALGALAGGGGISGKMLGFAAIAAALGELVHLVSETAEYGHTVEAAATAVGVSTGQLRAWDRAAGQASVQTGILVKAIEQEAVAAKKAADEQTKHIVKDAEALDSGDIVARGGQHGKPVKPSAQIAEFAPVQKTPELEAFFRQRYTKMEEERALERQSGQVPRPLEPFETFYARGRNTMADLSSKVGEQLRQDAARQNVPKVPVGTPAEGYERLLPGFKDAFAQLGVAVLDEKGKFRELAAVTDEVTKALHKLPEGIEKAAEFQKVYGRAGRDPFFRAFMDKEAAKGAGSVFATPESEDENVKALAKLKAAQNRAVSGFQQGSVDFAGGLLRSLKAINEDKGALAELGRAIDQIPAEAGHLDAAGQDFDALKAKIQGVIDAAKAAASDIGSLLGGGGPAAEAAIPAKAAGGLLHGPGSGTSDSILARVSNGEFVVNAAATAEHLPTLHAINSGMRFAAGGMVGWPSIPSFSGGGMVGGHPVHLHLGGDSYELHGSDHVVGQLVAAASRQQMASGGTKPSWHGR